MRGQVALRTEPLRDVNSITSSSIQRLSCEVRQGNFTFRCCVFSTVKWGQGHLFPRACVRAKLLQSCLTLWDPVHCSLPGSSVLGFSRQAYRRGLPMPSSRGFSRPRDWTHISYISCIGRQVLYTTWEAHFPGRETQTTISTETLTQIPSQEYTEQENPCLPLPLQSWLCTPKPTLSPTAPEPTEPVYSG